jgi:uncharacterized protein (TIGR04255 family)
MRDSVPIEPCRLRREPIIEALSEIRFSGNKEVGSLLPGLLLPKFRDKFGSFERLPHSELPSQLREVNPAFSHIPLYRLSGPGGSLAIGDRVLQVIAPEEYPGWKTFQPLVTTVWKEAIATGLLGTIERVSVKYVNFFAVSDSLDGTPAVHDLSEITRALVKVGSHQVKKDFVQLKIELHENDCTTIVQIVNPALVQRPAAPPERGLILDIDTIYKVDKDAAIDDLSAAVDAAHTEEKRVFFELLSESTLKQCEPTYA